VFERILVAVDGSHCAHAASDLAIALAKGRSSLIFCYALDLSVLDAPIVGHAGGRNPMFDQLRAEGQAILTEAGARAERAGVSHELVLQEEEPVRAILDAAAARGCGLIVIGSHGRQGLARLFLGSVAEGVLRASHIPVLAVRSS
jgi:nucleotide-binding universal stress UspA family protein